MFLSILKTIDITVSSNVFFDVLKKMYLEQFTCYKHHEI